ncbi:MAG: cyclic nucleotide-binding domain-containing protein [Stellaceae bacterium]
MRLTAPLIFLLIALALVWTVDHDAGGVVSFLPSGAGSYISIVLQIAAWLAGAWLATALFGAIVWQFARRRTAQKQNKLPQLLIDVGRLAIFFCAGLAIVSQVFNQPLGGLLATSGVAAAIIGFSVQKTIADVVSGIGLNIEQTLKLGDWIEAGHGEVGRVVEVTWRTTHLETFDGRLIVIPNSTLISGPFTNWSAPQRFMRTSKTVEIEYEVPSERVLDILQAAIVATGGVLAYPEPDVYIDTLADNGIVYSMHFWVADYPDTFSVARDVLVNALKFLDQAGISPVYPKTDVMLIEPFQRHIDRRIDVAGLLRRMPFFAAFEAEAQAALARDAHLRDFPAQGVVVHEGDPGASLFVVIEGVLDVTKKVAGRPERRLGRLVPGEIFGEMSLLTGADRSATVTAATRAALLEIDKRQIEPMLATHPEAIAALGQLVAGRAAANESLLAIWPEERQEIARMGVAAFLLAKMGQFFGRALS